jgi:YesN/AraC family two-component response regulator
MDKSFNDQELSDIMKEIEALEEEFKEESVSEASDSVLENLAEMDEVESVPLKTEKPMAVVHQFEQPAAKKTPTTSNSTSMSFKVQGDLNLELSFDIGGKTVSLEVTEAGLTIQMEGGMTFTVPMSEAQSLKKTA